jgi:hypothetical protein
MLAVGRQLQLYNQVVVSDRIASIVDYDILRLAPFVVYDDLT